jgi:hypothetical protein
MFNEKRGSLTFYDLDEDYGIYDTVALTFLSFLQYFSFLVTYAYVQYYVSNGLGNPLPILICDWKTCDSW